MMTRERESNIELLRLVLMLMIVLHHGFVHGLGLDSFVRTDTSLLLSGYEVYIVGFLNCFLIGAVNAFVFISGYFGITLKLEKLYSIAFPTLFYTILFTTTYFLLTKQLGNAVQSLLFLSHGNYWFVLDYLFLMCVAPLLNSFFNDEHDKMSTYILVSLFIICCYFGFIWGNSVNRNGYTFIQFIFIYFLGRYIKTKGWILSRRSSVALYLGTSIICGLIFCFCYYRGAPSYAWKVTFYNNPLVVINGISLFFFFKSLNIRSKFINKVAASAFSIYLVQKSQLISDFYYSAYRSLHTMLDNDKILHISLLMGGGILLATVVGVVSILIDQIQIIVKKKVGNVIFNSINR